MKKTFVIGVWFLVAIALLYIGMNFLKGLNVFDKGRHYYVVLDEVSQVGTATPVFINGYQVGNVQAMNFEFQGRNRTVVTMNLDKKVKLPVGTQVAMEESMFTGAELHLSVPAQHSGTYYTPGDTLLATSPKVGLMEQVEQQLLPAAQKLIAQLDSTSVLLQAHLSNPDIQETIRQLRMGTQELKEFSARINKSSIKIDPLLDELNSIATQVQTLTTSVEGEQLKQIVADLERSGENLKAFSTMINNPNGTVGKAFKDEGLYNRLDSLVNSTESLINDIKANPKRYLTVKIF